MDTINTIQYRLSPKIPLSRVPKTLLDRYMPTTPFLVNLCCRTRWTGKYNRRDFKKRDSKKPTRRYPGLFIY